MECYTNNVPFENDGPIATKKKDAAIADGIQMDSHVTGDTLLSLNTNKYRFFCFSLCLRFFSFRNNAYYSYIAAIIPNNNTYIHAQHHRL